MEKTYTVTATGTPAIVTKIGAMGKISGEMSAAQTATRAIASNGDNISRTTLTYAQETEFSNQSRLLNGVNL